MLSVEELEVVLSGGRELRNFEVKGPGPRSDSHLMAKVIRAALSMGNLRDGGYVLVGLDDGRLAEMQPGLSDADASSWLSVDDVARKFAQYSDPPLEFDVVDARLSSGAHVALIEVYEFADVPHLCTRQYDGVLRRGALYVRSRGVAESGEVSDPVELREVIDLATEKALRRFVETASRGGVQLSTNAVSLHTPFEQQRDRAFE